MKFTLDNEIGARSYNLTIIAIYLFFECQPYHGRKITGYNLTAIIFCHCELFIEQPPSF